MGDPNSLLTVCRLGQLCLDLGTFLNIDVADIYSDTGFFIRRRSEHTGAWQSEEWRQLFFVRNDPAPATCR